MPRKGQTFSFRHHAAKLSWDAVLDMRERFWNKAESLSPLAAQYGVHYQTAYKVVMGDTYKVPKEKKDDTR